MDSIGTLNISLKYSSGLNSVLLSYKQFPNDFLAAHLVNILEAFYLILTPKTP